MKQEQIMTYEKVKEYYGRSYSKIIKALSPLKDKCTFRIDTFCGRYLELFCEKNNGFYLKVNHGLSNKLPFNIWYKPYSYATLETKSFATQKELVDYLEKIFK